MLTIFLITLITLFITMVITAKAMERKEKRSIECELSKYCEAEKLNQCTLTKETSVNYLTMTEK